MSVAIRNRLATGTMGMLISSLRRFFPPCSGFFPLLPEPGRICVVQKPFSTVRSICPRPGGDTAHPCASGLDTRLCKEN